MATITASPPSTSPPPAAPMTKSPPLPPLITTPQSQRKSSNHRPSSLLARRISSFSSHRSIASRSRPISTIFPAYPSSLPYALVRDFAYPWSHPMHYGPPPDDPTPSSATESRRVSDPTLANWEDSRSQWSATPPWMADNSFSSRDQLPARTFNDGGPPYSEDEDLQSPVVTTSRHRKQKSERGRSPGAAGPNRGVIIGAQSDRIEQYRPTDSTDLDGPAGEIETYSANPHVPQHRDSNFAKPLQRTQASQATNRSSDGDFSDEDEVRFSRDYSFSIASPDEEMHGKAVALFDFESEHENELPLREGQIILVSYRHGQGWLVAENPITGESGLVPEEFVRLVRHIEGGLNGLNSLDEVADEGIIDDEAEMEADLDADADTLQSPESNDPGSAITPTPPNDGFEKYAQPAVQSNFSTHTRDFSPMPNKASRDKSGAGKRHSLIPDQKRQSLSQRLSQSHSRSQSQSQSQSRGYKSATNQGPK